MLRDTTERPEGIDAGTLKLVGTDSDVIYKETMRLLTDSKEYDRTGECGLAWDDPDVAINWPIEGLENEFQIVNSDKKWSSLKDIRGGNL